MANNLSAEIDVGHEPIGKPMSKKPNASIAAIDGESAVALVIQLSRPRPTVAAAIYL